MPTPANFNPQNPQCPQCGGPMWDNRNSPKRTAKSPHYRCKNRQCQGAVWLDEAQLAAAAPPPTAAPHPVASGAALSIEEWITATNEVATAVMAMLAANARQHTGEVATAALLTETRSLVATFWICESQGRVQIKAAPAPEKVAARYKAQIAEAADMQAVMRLLQGIAGASDLDGTEKEELSLLASERLSALRPAA